MKILRAILFFAVLLFAFEDVVLAINNLQSKFPILGLRFSDRPLKLVSGKNYFVIKQSDIGIDKTEILKIGREGSLTKRLLDQNLALFGLKKIDARISQGLLALEIMEIQDKVDSPAIPAMPDFINNIDTIVPAKNGTVVDVKSLVPLIGKNIFYPPFFSIAIPTKMDVATSQDLTDIRNQAENLSKDPILVSSGGKTFILNYQDVLRLLTVTERTDPKDPKKQILLLRLDDTKLNRLLGDFAKGVEDVTNAEFDYHDARVAIYSEFYSNRHKNLAIPTGMAKRQVLGAQTPSGPKIVYLTFDDGPNSIYHPVILDILKAYGIKATFFLVGNNAVSTRDVATRTFLEGHVLGNHSLTHPFLPNFSSQQILNELQKTEEILQPINGGVPVTLFRPPYGGVNSNVTADATKLGMKLFLWTVDPRDWSEPTTDELVRRVVTATTNGSDILLHSNHLVTVKALPRIIETLKGEGYSFAVLQ